MHTCPIYMQATHSLPSQLSLACSGGSYNWLWCRNGSPSSTQSCCHPAWCSRLPAVEMWAAVELARGLGRVPHRHFLAAPACQTWWSFRVFGCSWHPTTWWRWVCFRVPCSWSICLPDLSRQRPSWLRLNMRQCISSQTMFNFYYIIMSKYDNLYENKIISVIIIKVSSNAVFSLVIAFNFSMLPVISLCQYNPLGLPPSLPIPMPVHYMSLTPSPTPSCAP